MNNLTNAKIALIAAAASMLTSAMHGGIEAVFALHYDSVILVLGYILGRVIGDAILPVICFGIVYGLLAAAKARS
jgi:hypothetical protein